MGRDATLEVVATGQVPLTYQWCLNGTNLVEDAHYRGVTGNRLTLASVRLEDAGDYTVLVGDASGAVLASQIGRVSVTAGPVFTPIPDQVVDEECLLTFAARATEEGLLTSLLSFSLDAGAPAGAGISADGVFTWLPTEAQGPSTNPVTIRLSDGVTNAV